MAQRPQLSLTAELEKIEQKITLTLQEIDHNFARAHRIVTTSILPIIDRYEKESDAVWEGSKFWKQFFEASANVALTNYQEEEQAEHEEGMGEQEETQQQEEEEGQTYVSSPGHYTAGDDFTRDQETRNTHHEADDDDDDELLDDSLLESLNLTTSGGPIQSTPKRAKEEEPEWADMESPFDALAKELTMKYGSPERPPPQQQERQNFFSAGSSSSMLPPPSTPPRNRRHSTPESSPFRAPPVARTPGIENDRVMHRVQNKNWRIQATPLRSAMKSRYRTVTAATPKQPPLFSRNNNARILDPSSPLDSPPEPQLHTQIFTPGVLRTPGAKRIDAEVKGAAAKYMYDDDSDDDLFLPPGFSPPKTIQFSLPASKLMATPAREASRKIVRDILQTAGASVDGTMTTVESSPMRGGRMDEDDSF